MLTGRCASTRAATLSAGIGGVLVALAIIVPRALNEKVGVNWPPLHADWMPRFGPMSLIAITLGLGLWLILPRWCADLSWRRFMLLAYATTWSWIMALAYVDGPFGLSRVFDRKREYVYDAQRVHSIPDMLRTFVDHIPYASVDNWQTHVAGHPPGALLFFVLLDRLGITSHLWIAIVVVSIGATAVVAAILALGVMGNEHLARTAAPWLILAPAAVWTGVNGDAVFTAVAAWGLCLLAIAAKTKKFVPAISSGVLLGLCVYLSYGLVLLAVPALAVLLICRTWRPLPLAMSGALLVTAGFTLAGFSWWEAYPVLVDRYNEGIASDRAYSYWVWANVAAWTFTVGLATWAAFPSLPAAIRRHNPLAIMATACLTAIVIADLSGMSKAEVERIWLPFTLWIVALPALLPRSLQRPLLLSQVVLALVVQHLVLTRW